MINIQDILKRNSRPGWPGRFAVLFCLCLFRLCVFAQDSSFSTVLLNTFTRYSAGHLTEKCFVHTDKNDYLAGEVLWFKVYAVDGLYNKPLSLSKVVYAELLDAENNPVLQGKIALVNGDARGSFDLPDTLSGGWYRFRAYTNWMKNAGPDYFFEKTLRIYNAKEALSKPAVPAENPFNGYQTDTAVNASGYTLGFEKKNSQTDVMATAPPGSAAESDSLWLLAQAHGVPVFCVGAKQKDRLTRFSITEPLPVSGIVQLTLVDAKKNPVCEKLIFIPGPQIKIGLSDIPAPLHLREAVTITVATTDEKANPLTADLSVSVFRTDSLSTPERGTMPGYYLLQSELPGVARSDGDGAGLTAMAASGSDGWSDSLLVHRKWTRFSWKQMLDTATRFPVFPPETRDPVITGRVVTVADGKPAPRIYAYASVAGKKTLFRAAESDDRGIVRFEMPGFTGSNQLIVQTAKEDSAYRVELINPFSTAFRQNRSAVTGTGKGAPASLAERLFNQQIESIYQGDSLQQWKPSLAPGTFFYGKPDYRYHLDDYKRFTTMEEVMREYVKACNVFRSEGMVKLVLFNQPAQQFFTDPPLVLIDGVPVFDQGRPMNLDPLKISDIELVNRGYVLGPQKFSGIINCLSYRGDLAGFTLPAQAAAVDYEGLQPERKFYSPSYATVAARDSRVPDYRTQLYWEPSLQTGADGKAKMTFYTSDIPGRYTVVVHGINEKGISGSRTIEFSVSDPGNKVK